MRLYLGRGVTDVFDFPTLNGLPGFKSGLYLSITDRIEHQGAIFQIGLVENVGFKIGEFFIITHTNCKVLVFLTCVAHLDFAVLGNQILEYLK
ncbi:hypothetical protein LT42_25455 [Pseudomonas lutea]|uniref:Uncharacterized protein n=1 Tax=Pseudomonas lutea TaxID=243924 RepID=A0A9X0EAA8_9PSED|nr:hypothetical protein LT42_25455 [Pseudomonas lutea]